jgi:hypothetical protein
MPSACEALSSNPSTTTKKYTHKKKKKKCVEIVLRRGERGRGRMMEGLTLIKVHCKHICKCHNETSPYN